MPRSIGDAADYVRMQLDGWLLTAYLILSRATELRDLLHLYSAAVRRAVHIEFDSDDGLF